MDTATEPWLARFSRWLVHAWAHRARKPHLAFMFTGMGRIAKSSGSVSPGHVAYTEEVMRRLHLTGAARKDAITWFRQGRDGGADFHALADRCNQQDAASLARMCLESFVAIAELVPAAAANRTLHFLASLIGLDATAVQRRRHVVTDRKRIIEQACHVLGVAVDAGLADQKRAYRQLASRYHPDKLPAQASPRERDYAQQRTIEIRSAWEVLQAAAEEDGAANRSTQAYVAA